MVLVEAVGSGAGTATARSVQDDGLHEERVIVEVVLHEKDIAFSLLPCPLYHDIQGALSAHTALARLRL